MTDLKRQLKEDRAIRDAARSIITAQITQVRQGISGQRIGEKLADKVSDDVIEKVGKATDAANKNKTALAGVAGVIALALAWKPVAKLIDGYLGEDTTTDKDVADDT